MRTAARKIAVKKGFDYVWFWIIYIFKG
jgi:hypothetical protein